MPRVLFPAILGVFAAIAVSAIPSAHDPAKPSPAAPSPAPRTKIEPRRADVRIRYSVHSDSRMSRVEKVFLTTLVPQDDIPGQRVESVEFEPRPTEEFDRDGQRYARFTLSRPTEESVIEVRLKLTIDRNDLDAARAREPGKAAAKRLEGEERRRALKHERFLECDDLAILKLADRVTADTEIGRIEQALALTVDQLSPAPYSSADVGARAALDARQGDCTEYSDLLTAVLRAKQIPARRTYGFVLESANTPKHDWVEAFTTDHGWIAFDPLHVERGAATVDRLRPIYVRLSTARNDEVLNGYHYFSFRNDGGSVRVDDEFTVLSLLDVGDDAALPVAAGEH